MKRAGFTRPKVVSKLRRTKAVAYTENWEVIRIAVLKRDGYRCVECGSTFNLEVHHIIPVSRGGKTVMFNLKTLCGTCHNKKHHHLHSR
jgi:5-methylcytosine-specific restriction protein A